MRLFAVLVCVLLVPVLNLAAVPAAHAASSGLELTELLVDPAPPLTDANDEYVELHNAGAMSIALGSYKLKVGASTALHALPNESLLPGATVNLTSQASPWALTNTGGTISLLDSSGAVIDTTTWTQAPSGATWTKDAAGKWAWSSAATPAPGSVGKYPELELNELLPDPASPLTDAKDEFVELFNPYTEPVNLSGYVIKTGASLATKHTLLSAQIPAGGYLALKSADTKIALANGGSSVALFDPSGNQLGPTVTYEKAKTGAAWARINGSWAWTSQPTPGSPNVLAELPVPVASTKTAKSSSSAKTAKASKAKSSAASTKSKAKASSNKQAPAANNVAATPSGTWLLFVLAGLTLAYVIYEFRYDLLNFYQRLRRHPRRRGAAVEAAQGR